MNTSRDGGPSVYLGADLTSRYSDRPRPVDVAGLDVAGEHLVLRFWTWEWGNQPDPIDIAGIADELRTARCSLIDGPQGLASAGEIMRHCERVCGAAGKTPHERPPRGRMFADYICSSLDLFAAIKAANIAVSPETIVGGVGEVYPGHVWRVIAGRNLPKKTSDRGRRYRRAILTELGVFFPNEDIPTHDQNDAGVAALLAAAADGRVRGLVAQGRGKRVFVDRGGLLREGPMIVPHLDETLRERMSRLLAGLDSNRSPAAATTPTATSQRPEPECLSRAERLLEELIACVREGDPKTISYRDAFERIVGNVAGRWSRGYAAQVERIAKMTIPRDLPQLGLVRLDSFIVDRSSGRPGEGHWRDVEYVREDWERIIGIGS